MAKYKCLCTYHGQQGEPVELDTIEAADQEEADGLAVDAAAEYCEVEGWAVKVKDD